MGDRLRDFVSIFSEAVAWVAFVFAPVFRCADWKPVSHLSWCEDLGSLESGLSFDGLCRGRCGNL